MLKVSAIGSCRVFTPLGLMGRRDRISIGHTGAEWYTHSTEDVLQKLDIMNGERQVEDDVLPLLVHGVEKFHAEAIRPDFYAGTDVFVVEIASIKDYVAGDWHLQQWCVRDALLKADEMPGAAKIAEGAELKVQSKDELVAGMRAIVDKFDAPVVFVPHVNVVRDDGTPIPERNRIHEAMTEACADGSAHMFDPTPHVYEAGYDVAMIDSGHYRGPYELEMGGHMVEFLAAKIGARAA